MFFKPCSGFFVRGYNLAQISSSKLETLGPKILGRINRVKDIIRHFYHPYTLIITTNKNSLYYVGNICPFKKLFFHMLLPDLIQVYAKIICNKNEKYMVANREYQLYPELSLSYVNARHGI